MSAAALLACGLVLLVALASGEIKCLGVFGAPEQIWKAGGKLSDFGITGVWVGHRHVNAELLERCHAEGARVFAEIAMILSTFCRVSRCNVRQYQTSLLGKYSG